MITLFIFLSSVLVACGIGLLAGFSDFKGMKIPNLYSVIVLGAFVIFYMNLYFSNNVELASSLYIHVLSGLVMFGLTFGLFAIGILGAGDSKIASAYAVWLGFAGLPAFLVYMSITGGILGITALIIMKTKPFKDPAKDSWIDRLQKGESKVPYGIAIFIGALASFSYLGYFDLETYKALADSS